MKEKKFPDEFRQLIRDAWREIEQEETFPELERQISTAEENELRSVGLLGSQLSLKLGIFDSARERFRRFSSKWHLSSLLETIKNILSSVSKFANASEKIKELVDAIIWLVKRIEKSGERR